VLDPLLPELPLPMEPLLPELPLPMEPLVPEPPLLVPELPLLPVPDVSELFCDALLFFCLVLPVSEVPDPLEPE